MSDAADMNGLTEAEVTILSTIASSRAKAHSNTPSESGDEALLKRISSKIPSEKDFSMSSSKSMETPSSRKYKFISVYQI
jgi:hypothetical protein